MDHEISIKKAGSSSYQKMVSGGNDYKVTMRYRIFGDKLTLGYLQNVQLGAFSMDPASDVSSYFS